MFDIPSISAVVAAVGVIVGVVFTVLELRSLVKTRQTDLLVRLYSIMGSKEFQEAWDKFMTSEYEDYNDHIKKYGVETFEVGIFFEGIGVLLHRKLIDIGLVNDLFNSPIKMTWEKMKPIAEAMRKHLNQPQMGEWFEYIYNEMQKREQRLAKI